MKTVYVVQEIGLTDGVVCAVFSTYTKAKEYIAKADWDHYEPHICASTFDPEEHKVIA